MNASHIGAAKLLLITDSAVGDEHVALILKLAGRGITRKEIALDGSARTCTWPLEIDVPEYTSIHNVGSHIWHIADYLMRNCDTVHLIHAIGCNLQLNIYNVTLDPPISVSASALKQLGDLEIQLELFP